MKKYEIWATFENGSEVKVETHKTEESARIAIDAMNHNNRYQLTIGYGFPYGMPIYSIRSRDNDKTRKPSSTRKYICPKCSSSVRATRNISIICGECYDTTKEIIHMVKV